MNFKNVIPIKTHTQTHLINTCSNKFDATLGFKNIRKSKNCFRKIGWYDAYYYYYYYSLQTLTIRFNQSNMIVHTWATLQGGLLFSYFSFWHHLTVKCDFASSENMNVFFFLYKCDMNENFGVKMSQKYDHFMICLQQRRYCRPRIHKITKGLFYFLFSPHSDH